MEKSNFNQARRSIFHVFRIDKSVTDIKSINEAVNEAKRRVKFGKVVAGDGTPLDEAQVNSLLKSLLDPIERLKAEQFVHQAHLFSKDGELAECVSRLEQADDPLPQLLAASRGSVLSLLYRFLPPLTPPALEDDLPWPEPPTALALVREGLEDAILRDR